MNNYSLEVKKIFKKAEKIAMELNHPYEGLNTYFLVC